MSTGVVTWSQTASSNATADSNVNWAEGQAPSSVNDSARAMMASVAKWRDDIAGALTTGGTSTAYTLTTNQVFASLSAMSGHTVRVKFDKTCGANPTLNVDGLNAKAIVTVTGTAVGAGTLQANNIYELVYANGSSEWILVAGTAINGAFAPGTAIPFFQASAPTGWTKSTANDDKAIRIVSGTGGGTGGSTAFSTVFAARTIARANLPNVDFMADGAGNIPVISDTAGGAETSKHIISETTFNVGGGAAFTAVFGTAVPKVSGHIYLNGNTTQTAVDFAVNYIDCIICTKN